jgi:hypothetical protein
MSVKETLLAALEIEKKGDWDYAHRIVQVMEHKTAYWIHAYLHRKEPDPNNATYWYSRAGKKMPRYSFDKEWKELFEHISKSEFEE